MASLLTFGSYVFPASFYLATKDQSTTIDSLKVPMLDGTTTPVGTRDQQTITLKGTIGGAGSVDSLGGMIQNRDQCNAELNLMAANLYSGYNQLRTGNADLRYIVAQCAKLTHNYESGRLQAIADVQVDFHSPDPRWLSNLVNSVMGNASGATINATNAGSATAYPVITFHAGTGGAVNPGLQVNPYGGGAFQVNLGYTTAAGDTIVVDCNPRNRANAVLLNGTRALHLLNLSNSLVNDTGTGAMFPFLTPGTNTVGAVITNGTFDVAWQDAWLV